MSIVCCKVTDLKIEIASDSITVRGWTQSKGENVKLSKLVKINDIIFGVVGSAEEGVLMQLFCETHQPKFSEVENFVMFMAEFADWKKEKTDNRTINNSYIFVYKNRAFCIDGFLVSEITTYEAIGGGADFALACLYLGHDAKKAVEAACELSIVCEKPIVYYEIERE